MHILTTCTLVYLLHCIVQSSKAATVQRNLPEKHDDSFYYFGYGSNMLADRIHIQNPTAVRIGMGMLKNFRLDFDYDSSDWFGTVATIVPSLNATIYGALWNVDIANLKDIDDQEGVSLGIYEPISVPVLLSNATEVIARAYMLVHQPQTDYSSYAPEDVPNERQTSKTYLQCLVKGAQETEVPKFYLNYLKSLKHNGRTATKMENLLHLKDVELFS